MNGAPKHALKVISGSAAQPDFGPGDLGRVAGNEVIQRLVRGQPGNRRHDALRVAGQQHDILGMPARFSGIGVVDELTADTRRAYFR